MLKNIEPMKLMITIVELKHDSFIESIYNEQGIHWQYRCTGHGTASSDLQNVLGFETTEREILLSMATKSTIERLMYDLNNDLRSTVNAKGIAFDMPLTGINSLLAMKLMEYDEKQPEREEINMPQSATHSLILVSVKQGFSDEVMDTAKAAGARGGSIIRGRRLGDEEREQFYGFTLQGEQEIILMVVPTSIRNRVMDDINAKHGVKAQGGAFVYSLGVDHVVQLT